MYSYGETNREFPFVFPTGDKAPKEERVTFWFKRAKLARERELQQAMNVTETDVNTGIAVERWDASRMDELYAECLQRIENLDLKQEDGQPADLPANNRDKRAFFQNVITGNLGFQEIEKYGSFQDDLAEWFIKTILRRSGNLRKNSKTPSSDTSADGDGKASQPSADSTPLGAAK